MSREEKTNRTNANFLTVVGIPLGVTALLAAAYFGLQVRGGSNNDQTITDETQPRSALATQRSSQSDESPAETPNTGKNCAIVPEGGLVWPTAQGISDPETIYDHPVYEVTYPRPIDGISTDYISPATWNVKTRDPYQERLRGRRGDVSGATVCALDYQSTPTPGP